MGHIIVHISNENLHVFNYFLRIQWRHIVISFRQRPIISQQIQLLLNLHNYTLSIFNCGLPTTRLWCIWIIFREYCQHVFKNCPVLVYLDKIAYNIFFSCEIDYPHVFLYDHFCCYILHLS